MDPKAAPFEAAGSTEQPAQLGGAGDVEQPSSDAADLGNAVEGAATKEKVAWAPGTKGENTGDSRETGTAAAPPDAGLDWSDFGHEGLEDQGSEC